MASPLDRHMEEALSGHETDAPPQRLWLILSTYASFIEAQGWELVARYYQRRLDALTTHPPWIPPATRCAPCSTACARRRRRAPFCPAGR